MKNGMIRGDLYLSAKDNDLRKNASGYSDLTAYKAIANIETEDKRFHKLLHTIFYICELA